MDFYLLRLPWFLPWPCAHFPSGKNQPKLQYGTMLRANQPASSCIMEGDRICLQWAKYSVTGLFPLLMPLLTLSTLIPPEGFIHHPSTLTLGKEFISQHKVEGLGWCPVWPLGLGSGMNSHLFRINWTCRMVGRPIEEFTKNNEKQLVEPFRTSAILETQGYKYCGS